MSKTTSPNYQLLCQYLGGSHLYGLNTPTSDEDVRYVFLNTDIGQILGLDRFEHLDKRNATEDSFGMELRGFLNLLRKTNTQVLELLFAPKKAFTQLDSEFERCILKEKTRFIDSDRFYKSLKGYIFTERRLALGERAGQIGGKRYSQVEQFGYSPKNMVQLFRLTYAGIEFFRSGVFPTSMKEYNPEIWGILMDIKTNPTNHNPEELVAATIELEKELETVYQSTNIHYTFDLEYANWTCAWLYKKLIESYFIEFYL